MKIFAKANQECDVQELSLLLAGMVMRYVERKRTLLFLSQRMAVVSADSVNYPETPDAAEHSRSRYTAPLPFSFAQAEPQLSHQHLKGKQLGFLHSLSRRAIALSAVVIVLTGNLIILKNA